MNDLIIFITYYYYKFFQCNPSIDYGRHYCVDEDFYNNARGRND